MSTSIAADTGDIISMIPTFLIFCTTVIEVLI